MPEGHVIHRLAGEFTRIFGTQRLHITSPQGRFATEAELVDGSRLERAEAFGKHLFLHFDAASDEHIIYIHLGLIGHLRFEDREKVWGQIRLRIETLDDDGSSEDTTNLAANLRGPQWCRLITDEEYAIAVGKIGEDPIRDDANPRQVWAKVQRSKRSIGSLLMDQKLFAGVGNIYRAEVLFRHQQSPFTPGNAIDRSVFFAMWEDLVALMRQGVVDGEINTVRDEHTPEVMHRPARDDEHGGEVYVYRRAGDDCYVCGSDIAMKAYEGRNLFWCPTCQA
ncbi:Fpg/Nei family DNA glycosylase [Corynebacterium pseudodiphtheriticum]|uniref:Fpg/Nei family DNA glycosylase n=1 Tax=Corynebacterium pseudodiphtheriticum TaxID=37637 RepID=UPI00254D466C|nr:DNA-formamidopyrimidine glycosylase family protein [Corynebacterium pseudodiphtheriticum]MDK8479221.1 Fpg/Nei family DNA glycosylase [Corynebacterium pseudodiphtheriticum]MDK8487502.1 Fpg/Nei family DNA glycosylase [Corynebacterium pseudodiphtheriticum]MDK8494736.1 Fpg/Nei family DNA glycosylase [Corynebacterium pseudodiphtheriticum]